MTDKNAPIHFLVTEMPDGSKWGVEVKEIAENRARHYAHEFDGDVQRSLSEDTLPLFEANRFEIEDWAVNNMNWEDFENTYIIQTATKTDYDEGWFNGKKTFQTLE